MYSMAVNAQKFRAVADRLAAALADARAVEAPRRDAHERLADVYVRGTMAEVGQAAAAYDSLAYKSRVALAKMTEGVTIGSRYVDEAGQDALPVGVVNPTRRLVEAISTASSMRLADAAARAVDELSDPRLAVGTVAKVLAQLRARAGALKLTDDARVAASIGELERRDDAAEFSRLTKLLGEASTAMREIGDRLHGERGQREAVSALIRSQIDRCKSPAEAAALAAELAGPDLRPTRLGPTAKAERDHQRRVEERLVALQAQAQQMRGKKTKEAVTA